MSNSKPMSSRQPKQAHLVSPSDTMNLSQHERDLEMLRGLQKAGSLEGLVAMVQRETSQQLPIGAMTDGAKRRLESDDESFQCVSPTGDGYASSAPLAGTAMPVDPALLPPGVKDLEEWGRTICELPKVKDLNMSYKELRLAADSGDSDKGKYLAWVRSFNGQSVRTLDFQRYLRAVDSIQAVPQTYFPGSGEVRRLK